MTRRPTIPCCSCFRVGGARVLLTLAVLVLGLGAARLVRAAEPVDVENLIRQGVEMRQKGRDQAALPFFQRAYDLERSPRTAAQLGLVEASMGYWMAAERHLNEALASPRHPWVSKNRPELEQTLKGVKGSIGEVEIVGSPAGAEVLVNGKSEGVLPLRAPIRANDGMAQVTVRAAGFEEKQTTVQVSGGKREKVSVSLLPKPAKLAAAANETESDKAATPPPRPSRARAQLGARSQAPPPEKTSSSSAPTWVRPTAWVVGGLAVASVAVGGYGFLVMQQKQNEFNDRVIPKTTTRECSATASNKGSTGCKNIYDDTVSAQRLALNGLGAGALLLAASVVGFLWSAEGDDEAASARNSAPRAVASFDADGFRAGWRMSF